VLLRALARARAQVPALRAVIAGGGRYEPELRALAAELDLDGVVEWPGWVAEPDETLGRVHLYVNPWPDEGFGMAMAEAMSFALPVVAPASGSSPELVEDGVTGLLVAPRDPDQLAQALVRLAREPELATRMGATARERALARYGVRRTAASTSELYTRLLETRVR
jgi:glycosyltransferase involved in cell wall biosynthesis